MAGKPVEKDIDFSSRIKKATIDITLNDYTWTQSGSGKYYISLPSTTFDATGKTILGMFVSYWAGLRTTDVIEPSINNGTSFLVRANTNSFAAATSKIVFEVVYLE